MTRHDEEDLTPMAGRGTVSALTMMQFDTQSSREVVLRALSTSRLFRGVDRAFLETLAPSASIYRLEQGNCLWRRGTRAEHFHVIIRGILELQRAATGPESTLVALFGPGESPAIPVTLERRPFIADALATTPVLEVLRVRAEPILAALPHDADLGVAMTRALLDHCKLIHSKVDVLVAGTVPRRLAAFMLDLAERFGDEGLDGTTFVPLALSRAQYAAYVAARVETVIRVCSAWQKSGLLTSAKDGFTLRSLDELRAILASR